jgi:hypothetical protein
MPAMVGDFQSSARETTLLAGNYLILIAGYYHLEILSNGPPNRSQRQ